MDLVSSLFPADCDDACGALALQHSLPYMSVRSAGNNNFSVLFLATSLLSAAPIRMMSRLHAGKDWGFLYLEEQMRLQDNNTTNTREEIVIVATYVQHLKIHLS